MGGNLDGRGCVSASKMVFGFITPGMAIISIDYMARATCHWLTYFLNKPYKNVIPLSQQCYLRFLRVLRLRLSAAHSSPHLFLVHICSIGNMSGDKLYINLAVLHTRLPIVLSMLLLVLMVLQLTKIFVLSIYIPLGSKGSIQHKLSFGITTPDYESTPSNLSCSRTQVST